MKVITIGNLKGGVGKTTTTVNLAYSLSEMGKKILVIDMDPQCNCTRFFAKVGKTNNDTVAALMAFPERIDRIIRRTRYANVDIVRGSRTEQIPCLDKLGAALRKVDSNYDYCLVDTRPVFDEYTKSILHFSDVLLTPIKFDKFCRDNLALVEDTYLDMAESNRNLEWKVVANMVAPARSQRRTMKDLTDRHGYPILDTCISRSAVVDNALDLYKPVLRHCRGSVVAEDYLELAKEIIDMD